MLELIQSHTILLMLPITFGGMIAGALIARPLATLIYRLRGKGKYLPY